MGLLIIVSTLLSVGFAAWNAYLADRNGRNPFVWAIAGFLMQAAATVLLLAQQPRREGRTRLVRPWVVWCALLVTTLGGAGAGWVLAEQLLGPTWATVQSATAASLGADADLLLGAGTTTIWHAVLGLCGALLGVQTGITLAPFAALLGERACRAGKRPMAPG